MKKLPKRFKKKWLAALRSGEYKQGDGYLAYAPIIGHNEYCCLGVACLVAGVDEKHIKERCLIENDLETIESIPSILKGNKTGSIPEKLSRMNDGTTPYKKGKSFKEIANWIEKNL